MPDARANYPVFQAQLSHENDNLNQRIFWYVFSQSFLFGAYATVVNAPIQPKNAMLSRQLDLLVWVLPITALLISGLIYPTILISLRYMGDLRRRFEAQIGPDLDDLPPIHGDPTLRRMGDLAFGALPVVLIGIWLVILGAQVWGPRS